MRLHKEGYPTIIIITAALIALNAILYIFSGLFNPGLAVVSLLSLFGLFVVLNFFRNPDRSIRPDNSQIVSPADGTVVAAEITEETEFLKEKRLQVSVFMSVWDIHVNRFPVSGKVIYTKYRPGKYLLARNPKSSQLNEAHTTAIEMPDGQCILVRQIAGIMARRVVCYARENKQNLQGDPLGFIKFGSRADIFLPANAELIVNIGDKVKGNTTVLAKIPSAADK